MKSSDLQRKLRYGRTWRRDLTVFCLGAGMALAALGIAAYATYQIYSGTTPDLPITN
jgi:hypothetical protein